MYGNLLDPGNQGMGVSPSARPIKTMTFKVMIAMVPSDFDLTISCVHLMTEQQAENPKVPLKFSLAISLLLMEPTKLSFHFPIHWAGLDFHPSAQICSCYFLCFHSLQHTSLLQWVSGPVSAICPNSPWQQ